MPLAASTSCHLRHHRECLFVGPEVGIVEHGVRIQYHHHAHLVEVQSLGHHLCPYQDIGVSGTEIRDNTLIGIARARRVQIHTRHLRLGKDVADLFLNLLRAETPRTQVFRLTARTNIRNPIGVTTIVAGQLVGLSVQRQRHVAVLASGHPSTLAALHHRGEAATVLEEYRLLSPLQGLANTGKQKGREGTDHLFAVLQERHINNLNPWQLHTPETFRQCDKPILARLRVVVGFHGRGGRS